MIKTNIPEDDIEEEINEEIDNSVEKSNHNSKSEIISEDDNQVNIEESTEECDEIGPLESEEIEDMGDDTEIFEDIDDNSEFIEDMIERSEVIEELPQELSKEQLEKQLREYHKNLIEAALYAAGKPLNVEILSTKLEVPKKIVAELLNQLAFDYLERSTALVINQIGESYQMAIKSEYVEKISKFATGGAIAERYLRTLTIIALKQPILKSMVIKLRGSGAYEHVKYLLDNMLIDAVKKGRSQELTTTDKYAEMFGLPKDKDSMKEMMINQLGLGDQTSQPENTDEHEPQE